VIDAIAPRVALQPVLACWNQIATDLGERNRARKPQFLAASRLLS
jgi:hypothetical protein